jgi:hypothetical protein
MEVTFFQLTSLKFFLKKKIEKHLSMTSLHKYTSGTNAFTQHHVIRILKISILSLLLLKLELFE